MGFLSLMVSLTYRLRMTWAVSRSRVQKAFSRAIDFNDVYCPYSNG